MMSSNDKEAGENQAVPTPCQQKALAFEALLPQSSQLMSSWRLGVPRPGQARPGPEAGTQLPSSQWNSELGSSSKSQHACGFVLIEREMMTSVLESMRQERRRCSQRAHSRWRGQ